MWRLISIVFSLVVVLLIIAFIGMSCAAVVNGSIAVNDASKVSPQLGYELSAAQRTTNDEVARVQGLANANLANADAARLNAVATRTVEEARTISDERNAKKIGYGGLALKDFLDGGGGSCAVMVLVILFLAGIAAGKQLFGFHQGG